MLINNACCILADFHTTSKEWHVQGDFKVTVAKFDFPGLDGEQFVWIGELDIEELNAINTATPDDFIHLIGITDRHCFIAGPGREGDLHALPIEKHDYLAGFRVYPHPTSIRFVAW